MDTTNSIVHGINVMTGEFHGRTVGDVKNCLRAILNVGDEAVAAVGGRQVEKSYVLAPGDRLEFTEKMGQKGLGRLLTSKELIMEWGVTRSQYEELLGIGLPSLTLEGEVRHPEFTLDEFFRTLRLKGETGADLAADEDWPTIGPRPNTVTFRGKPAPLSQKSFDLMKLLVEGHGKPIPFVDISDIVYRDSRTLPNTIHGLRRELCKQLSRYGLGQVADSIYTPRGLIEHFVLDRDRLRASGDL